MSIRITGSRKPRAELRRLLREFQRNVDAEGEATALAQAEAAAKAKAKGAGAKAGKPVGEREKTKAQKKHQKQERETRKAARRELARRLVAEIESKPNLAPRVHYNIACFYVARAEASRAQLEAGRPPESDFNDNLPHSEPFERRALTHLERCLRLVYGDVRARYVHWAQRDPSLDYLDEDSDWGPDFRALLERFSEPAEVEPGAAEGVAGLIAVGPDLAGRLAEHGSVSWQRWLRLTSADVARWGLEPEEARRLQDVAGLLDLSGVGFAYANLLYQAGVTDRRELAAKPLEALEDDVAYAAQRLNVRRPSRRALKRWKAEAQRRESGLGPL